MHSLACTAVLSRGSFWLGVNLHICQIAWRSIGKMQRSGTLCGFGMFPVGPGKRRRTNGSPWRSQRSSLPITLRTLRNGTKALLSAGDFRLRLKTLFLTQTHIFLIQNCVLNFKTPARSLWFIPNSAPQGVFESMLRTIGLSDLVFRKHKLSIRLWLLKANPGLRPWSRFLFFFFLLLPIFLQPFPSCLIFLGYRAAVVQLPIFWCLRNQGHFPCLLKVLCFAYDSDFPSRALHTLSTLYHGLSRSPETIPFLHLPLLTASQVAFGIFSFIHYTVVLPFLQFLPHSCL